MILPGIVSATFRDKTVDEILQASSACGLKAIEWSEHAHVFPGDEKGAAELYNKTIAKGLQVAAYGSYFRLLEHENPTSIFRASLISAKALQAPMIRIWAGAISSAEADSDYRARLAAEAKLISDMAAEEGIKVALEWHRRTLTDTNESAFQLLNEADHPNLYCLWQPTPGISLADRCESLRELTARNKLLNIHCYYWKDDIRRPFSEGLDEWRQYLAQINAIEDRYVLMEFVMDSTWEQLRSDAFELNQLVEEFYVKGA